MTILQLDMLDFNIILQPLLSVFMLVILMIIMVVIYIKVKIWLVILVLFLFSIIFGINAMTIESIPFNPYFSIFFILFQSCFFLLISLEVYKK